MDAVATLCSSNTRARITFDHTTDTRFSSATDVLGCTNLNDPYTFTTQLYPGTYKVTVTRGGSGGSTLPNWATVSSTSFTVNAPQANVVFDVPIPPLHTVSGRITINGMDAVATLCSSSTRARITFEHLTDTRFSSATDVLGCTNLTDPYDFTTQLYPGIYKVTVTRGSSGGSTLPSWATVAVARLQVP
ncbi:MAG: hypothetical protein DI536_24025 [Archangium gephyra]|uniref:Uncharacterized protein n=1 Tax=Archangium gephyra TaxID=48 RepID=A0A2W5TC45_9BACT|nr:MAG: hypothetical protein DI536_24025 [Archangium gephyra]